MNIQILDLIEGARKARGLTVIIDVFRAFSVAAYAFAGHAEKIIPVGDLSLARKLKEEHPEYILLGERNEQKPEGFDYGNSPSAIANENLAGKTLVHTTSAGTQGIVNAVYADEIITGAFVNASAIVDYIKFRDPSEVSLVCMGYSTQYPVEEDSFCAEYIRNELEGRDSNFQEMKRIIRNTSGKRFFIPDKQHFAPSSDFELCLDINRFKFVIKAFRRGELFELEQVNV